MNCDRCGQRVNEVPECDHNYYVRVKDASLYCLTCGAEYGPVRELIEKAGKWDDIPTTSKVLQERIDLDGIFTIIVPAKEVVEASKVKEIEFAVN